MAQAGKRSVTAFKTSKREWLKLSKRNLPFTFKKKLKKRNLKKGKLENERSDTQSPEIDQICFGNGDDLKVAKSELKKASSGEKKEVIGDVSIENRCDAEEETVEEISSVDEDCSRGMKKWLLDYHQKRPGLDRLQQRLDEFMTAYDAEQEEARKERQALPAEGGWTVVVHHKGRKKSTDSESGIAVGSVAQAAVENKMAKKKHKELALDFYRFQKREAQRNEVMMLQSKFEQDKKRLQQLRAARKFRPY